MPCSSIISTLPGGFADKNNLFAEKPFLPAASQSFLSKIICMKMFFLFTALLFTVTGFSQSTVESYVKANTHPVVSINIHDDQDEDLEVIGRAIGDARIVSLGEQDHGDAPAFTAKTRLVRYLHEKKGFNVIAFESDFYSIVRAQDEAMVKGRLPMKLMKGNLFSIWTAANECTDLFNYIDSSYKSSTPVILTGFDSQLHGTVRANNYSSDMRARLQQAGSRFTEQIVPLFDYIQRYYPLHAGKVIPSDSLLYFDQIVDSINLELQSLPDSSFTKAAMRSLRGYTLQHIYMAKGDYETETSRDKQMAENLLWLYRYKYPDEKIIIWAHNYHIARNTFDAFPSRKYGKHYSMGNELAKVLKDTMYILGFTSYKGKAGRLMVKPFKVPDPKKNSIETWMAGNDPAYAFVDLRTFRSANPEDKTTFFMKGKFHTNAEAIWTDVFDGVFYIRDMYPATRK